jgi:hypothetical protein
LVLPGCLSGFGLFSALVADAPVSASGLSLLATQGSAFNGAVATFTDSGTAGGYTAAIDWGNGQQSMGTVTATGGESFTVAGSQTCAAEGPYSVTVHITDAGGSVATATSTVHVARNGPPPAQLGYVSLGLTQSTGYYSHVITSAYQSYLQRSPDVSGLAYWVGRLQKGLCDEELEAGFIGSAEYIQNHGGTGDAWVGGMYQDLLGRRPDPAGLQYWLDRLHQGADPHAIAYGFAASPEREAMRVREDYFKYLGRTPAQAEVDYWVDQFINHGRSNEGVIGGFVGSLEYYQRHYANVPDYLASAYQDILGRTPNPAGLKDWLAILET